MRKRLQVLYLQPLSLYLLLLFGNLDDVLAHIGLERLGYADRAVLVEVILEERDEHSRRSNNCIIERVSEVFVAVVALLMPSLRA